MTAFSDYFENEILDHAFGGGARAYTPPATYYMALFTAVGGLETNSPAISEVDAVATGYARVAVAFDAASGGAVSNTAAVPFPIATAAWGIVNYGAVVSNNVEGSGNILAYGSLQSSVDIGIGDTFTFQIGDIQISLD